MTEQQVRRGETLTFYADGVAGRNPPDWSVTYRIAGEGAKKSQVAALESSRWKAVFASSVTRDLPPGIYAYEAELTDGTEAYFIDSGRFELLPSLAHGDDREVEQTFAERALAKVEEVLLVASGSAEISFSVGDQSYTFESRGELMAFRETLRNEVRREQIRNSRGQRRDSNQIRVRLTNPGRSYRPGLPRRQRR